MRRLIAESRETHLTHDLITTRAQREYCAEDFNVRCRVHSFINLSHLQTSYSQIMQQSPPCRAPDSVSVPHCP